MIVFEILLSWLIDNWCCKYDLASAFSLIPREYVDLNLNKSDFENEINIENHDYHIVLPIRMNSEIVITIDRYNCQIVIVIANYNSLIGKVCTFIHTKTNSAVDQWNIFNSVIASNLLTTHKQ